MSAHDRYRILRQLGAGGMGIVFCADDRLTGRAVALKQVVLTPQRLLSASQSATTETHNLLLALTQEFKLLASLRDPNIISVLDYGLMQRASLISPRSCWSSRRPC